jgi:FixJ family two-component response regulator
LTTEANPVVFVVDDEHSTAEMIAFLLEREGFQVSTFYNPIPAMQQAALTPPDVVVTDFEMPEVNGLEFAAWLEKFCPACHIVMLTGHVDTLRESADRGPHFILLAKPLGPIQLIAAVKGTLRL